jgi:hypothetical protein
MDVKLQEFRLVVLENTLPRRIFEPWKWEISGGWRKLRNEELNFLLFDRY